MKESAISNVVQVVLKILMNEGRHDLRSIARARLCQAQRKAAVAREAVLFDNEWHFRTRPTKDMSPLITFQSWGTSSRLVLPQESPNPGDSRVFRFSRRVPILRSICAHRAKLVDVEESTVLADAALLEHHRPFGIQSHCLRQQANTGAVRISSVMPMTRSHKRFVTL